MSKISYSEYELQVLMAFLQKMEKREDAIISFVGFGHSKANWEEKTNYREPSLKEKYEKAFKTLVVKGDIYRLSEDEYACDYTKKELKQKIKEYQNPKPPAASESKISTIKIEDIDQINAPITSGIALKNKDSDDDDDDDLFLSSSDDDDDDLKDLPGVFSWKREPTEDVSEESTDDNVTEEAATEEKESYQTEMDKLLEELKQELEIADSNHEILETKTVDDAKIYVARLCKTRKEAKSKALEMQHKAQELDESSSSVIAFLGAYAEFDALSEKAYQKFRKENV